MTDIDLTNVPSVEDLKEMAVNVVNEFQSMEFQSIDEPYTKKQRKAIARREYQRRWRQANKDKIKEYNERWLLKRYADQIHADS